MSAKTFHYSVRNGKRWDHLALDTDKYLLMIRALMRAPQQVKRVRKRINTNLVREYREVKFAYIRILWKYVLSKNLLLDH